MKIQIVILCIFAICSSASQASSHLIVGGKKARPGDYPYNVSIRDQDGLHFCGGTLIDSRLVLTAAHCLDGGVPADYVIIGSYQLSDKQAEKIKVKDIVLHRKWDSKTNDNDLAVLVLEKKSIQKPILMNDDFKYTMKYSKMATIIGFGLTQEQGQISNDLLYAQVPLVDHSVCQSAYGDSITQNMFCAGFSSGGIDSCQTDSGGGVFFDNKLIGVISWGVGCARPGFYGVYAKTAHLNEWIQLIKSKISF